jgi:hypothetical protein
MKKMYFKTTDAAVRRIAVYLNVVFCCTIVCVCLVPVSCTGHVKHIRNSHAGKLTATHQLVVSGEKKIRLDYETAPKPPLMQLVQDASGARILTLLNPHRNAIYFYDYESDTYISNTRFEREGPNAVMSLEGYYVKNMDSIYVYDRPLTEIALTDSAGHVKQKISLKGSFADAET